MRIKHKGYIIELEQHEAWSIETSLKDLKRNEDQTGFYLGGNAGLAELLILLEGADKP